MATKWGIVSTGKISTDFVLCLNSLPKDEHKIVCVAARTLESAEKFSSRHEIPKAYGSYKELSEDPEVEIVYIANLNPDHFAVAKMMLLAGKNVLCEKPLTMNLADTEALIALAREKKLFLMEAIWSRCFPVYKQIRKEIANGTIGEPSMVEATFGANLQQVDRVTKKAMGGSAILDIGIYTIQFASMVYGGETPTKITATGFVNRDGVDEVATVTLVYSKERVANLTISSRNQLHNEAIIGGPDHFLRVENPLWCSTKLVTPTDTYEFKLPVLKEKPNFGNSEGLTYEAIEVRRCLQKGLLECPLIPLDETRTIAYIMEEVRKQLGAKM